MSDAELPPHDRLDGVLDEDIQRVTVTPQMLNELLTFGMTATTPEDGAIALHYDDRTVPQSTVADVFQTIDDNAPTIMPHEIEEVTDE